MPRYNLISEPWIPVRFLNGTVQEVGLREAITRAHEFQEIASDSPVEFGSLNRLLLALTVRIYAETENEDGWFDLWERGQFPKDTADRYFATWEERFDLFHPRRPFYQVRSNVGQSILRVGMLRLDEAGNVAKLFSHADLKEEETITAAQAARGVVGTQFASIGGLLSNPFKAGNRGTPFVSGSVFWLRGRNLFQALLLNAPPTARCRMDGEPGVPAWEQEEPSGAERRIHQGFLDYLTFQHRRITLETAGEDSTIVTAVRITGGDAEEPMPLNDPHMCVVQGDPTKPPGRYNMKKEHALWRDATLFMTIVAESAQPPRTFAWVSSFSEELGADQSLIDVVGLRTRGANDGTILFWRRETMPLFTVTLREKLKGISLQRALSCAEDQGKLLSRGAYITAARLLYHRTELSKNESEDARKYARALDMENRYWARLEQPFYALLAALAESGDDDSLLLEWARTLHRTARDAFDAATRALVGNANQLHARVEGRDRVRPVIAYSNRETETTLS